MHICVCEYWKYQNPIDKLIYGCVCIYVWYSNTLKSYAARRMTYTQTHIWIPSSRFGSGVVARYASCSGYECFVRPSECSWSPWKNLHVIQQREFVMGRPCGSGAELAKCLTDVRENLCVSPGYHTLWYFGSWLYINNEVDFVNLWFIWRKYRTLCESSWFQSRPRCIYIHCDIRKFVVLLGTYYTWDFHPLPLIQEEQLSVTGERMCFKYSVW